MYSPLKVLKHIANQARAVFGVYLVLSSVLWCPKSLLSPFSLFLLAGLACTVKRVILFHFFFRSRLAYHEKVLKHIANQARVQAAHMRLGTRTGSRRSGKAWRKILSDVDDTLTSSGMMASHVVLRRVTRVFVSGSGQKSR